MEASDSSNVSPTSFPHPAQSPPPGVESNFINPVTCAPDLVAASVLCLSLMVVCVAIRFCTKFHIKNGWGWDDCGGTSRPRIRYMLILPRVLYTCRGKTVSEHQNLHSLIHRRSVLLGSLALQYQVRIRYVILKEANLMSLQHSAMPSDLISGTCRSRLSRPVCFE